MLVHVFLVCKDYVWEFDGTVCQHLVVVGCSGVELEQALVLLAVLSSLSHSLTCGTVLARLKVFLLSFSFHVFGRDHLREFPLEMIFNIVYHTPDTITRTPEADADGSNGNGLSIEVQMAWGGSSTYNFQVRAAMHGHSLATLACNLPSVMHTYL